ncbi:hypothetical protein MAQ5080_02054 [Marinomonas aquimarina]|uniref:SnoaL-like domain-containing protein n=1 Tax=Marinomonas aquimarina TaxID=295068 RepID=A0A1A8THZ4_9GAMM|nr:nuclear transport factor 2 family protein [Marinomonas aquimarina]SBS31746.1 hypothetical protein MAQ5080_02054 [Marinomonas aquimarina]
MNTEQTNKLMALIDREEIRNLRLRYSELLDTGAAEQMGEVFTDDAVVKVTVGSMEGLAQIKQSLKDAYHSFDTLNRQHYPFMHAIANHQITLIDADNATGTCYLLDFVSDRPQVQHPFLLLGRYIDQYVKVNGEWRIKHSELDVVWPNE